MDIDRIITMASRGVRIQFAAFERSLRAVGCDLPLLLIPYDDDRFDLPPNAEWWEKEEFTSWLKESQAHPTMAKYVCLTEANYAYFDTDICLIEDCRPTLANQTGFVVADTELIRYGESATPESIEVLARKTSLWSLRLFNAGHVASDTPLYSLTDLESTCAKYKETCLLSPHHEQPGINLLALVSGVAVTNLCLPPHNMESTMAIDYADREDWEETWKQGRRPYFIHYAGGRAASQFPISRIFFDYLIEPERRELIAVEEQIKKQSLHLQKWPLLIRLLNRLVRIIDNRFYVQPKPYELLRDEAVDQLSAGFHTSCILATSAGQSSSIDVTTVSRFVRNSRVAVRGSDKRPRRCQEIPFLFDGLSPLLHTLCADENTLKIQILTIFPRICESVLRESILKRAQEKGLAVLEALDLRAWATDKHRTTDDAPYGGGPGMVMKIEPIARALDALRGEATRVLLMSPQGRRFDQKLAEAYSRERHLILVAGHYEGVDQRVADHLVDDEVSIGDYVLTNGALAALVVADAIVRLIPGVLGDQDSAAQDSFSSGILDYPHYTRPENFRGWKVPDVLLSGNHTAIEAWRRQRALEITTQRRPDLL